MQQVVEEVVVTCAGCHRVKTRANTWMRLREALIDPIFCLKEFSNFFHNLRIKEKVEKEPALTGFR